jgi:hypothetical protein
LVGVRDDQHGGASPHRVECAVPLSVQLIVALSLLPPLTCQVLEVADPLAELKSTVPMPSAKVMW